MDFTVSTTMISICESNLPLLSFVESCNDSFNFADFISIDRLGLVGEAHHYPSWELAINPFIPQQESGLAWTTIFDRTISLANKYCIYVTTLPVNDVSNLGKLYRIRLETVTAIGDSHENGIVAIII